MTKGIKSTTPETEFDKLEQKVNADIEFGKLEREVDAARARERLGLPAKQERTQAPAKTARSQFSANPAPQGLTTLVQKSVDGAMQYATQAQERLKSDMPTSERQALIEARRTSLTYLQAIKGKTPITQRTTALKAFQEATKKVEKVQADGKQQAISSGIDKAMATPLAGFPSAKKIAERATAAPQIVQAKQTSVSPSSRLGRIASVFRNAARSVKGAFSRGR